MADLPISGLPVVTTLSSSYLVPVVSGSVTSQMTVKQIGDAYSGSLSGNYVPYTGATGDVNLGTSNTLIAGGVSGSILLARQGLNITGYSNTGGNLRFKQYPSVNAGEFDSTTISAVNYDQLNIFFHQTGSPNYKQMILKSTLLTNNVDRTYSFPDKSGTVALLSDTFPYTGSAIISGSLKLTGSLNTIGESYLGGDTYVTGGYGLYVEGNSAQELVITSKNNSTYFIMEGWQNSTYAPDKVTSEKYLDGYVAYDKVYFDNSTFGITAWPNKPDVASYNRGIVELWIPTNDTTGSFSIRNWYNLSTSFLVNFQSNGRTLFNNAVDNGVDAVQVNGSAFISGSVTSSQDMNVNQITVGRGGGNQLSNTVVGGYALWINSSGTANTSVGYSSLGSNTTGYQNTAVGSYALASHTTGNQNTAVGQNALRAIKTTTWNTAIGTGAGYQLVSGSENTFLGYGAGLDFLSGSQNIFIGSVTGWGFQSGSNNVVISTLKGGNMESIGIVSGSNNTIIGSHVTGLSPTTSDTIILASGRGNISLRATGSLVTLTSILQLPSQHPLPAAASYPNSFAVSASSPTKPYYSDGTNWNALY